jgi:hypothetical protein
MIIRRNKTLRADEQMKWNSPNYNICGLPGSKANQASRSSRSILFRAAFPCPRSSRLRLSDHMLQGLGTQTFVITAPKTIHSVKLLCVSAIRLETEDSNVH